jgi:hypothetical protein
MKKPNLIINPKTKVLQLIETYPELEDVLIGYVPAFKKLKNPILRKTVAKVASLQQAAAVGNVKLEDLINLLRKAVGQDEIETASEAGYNTEQPAWFDGSKISASLDVREMLNAGEHPINQVIAELKTLPSENIYKITAPFLPAPLIDKTSSLGFDHWVKKENEELFNVFFKKS